MALRGVLVALLLAPAAAWAPASARTARRGCVTMKSKNPPTCAREFENPPLLSLRARALRARARAARRAARSRRASPPPPRVDAAARAARAATRRRRP